MPVRMLTEALIALASTTPDDSGCQALIAARLRAIGFDCETLEAGPADFRVTNLWAKRAGRRPGPLVVLAGHTDVVPTGPLEKWQSPPFVPTERAGRLYGRGSADMKTSLAAMVVAAEEFVAQHPDHAGSIAFLLTSDEEGPANDGTVMVCRELQRRGERLDYCIVGEPTSVTHLGDMFKNGRRGSLSGKLTVHGTQGHIAYPHLADNPIHRCVPVLSELVGTVWDDGNDYFPPTTWQISNLKAGTGATNVIPGSIEVLFNFRYSTASTPDGLKARLQAVLDRHQLSYDVEWTLGGEPFLTPHGTLCAALATAIRAETGLQPELSTTGGTSDGRFLAKICAEVVEFGPPNATIHQIDENIEVRFIEPLKNIYRRTLENLLLTC
jgi:succinyl-diaminopimelate desuccinylase